MLRYETGNGEWLEFDQIAGNIVSRDNNYPAWAVVANGIWSCFDDIKKFYAAGPRYSLVMDTSDPNFNHSGIPILPIGNLPSDEDWLKTQKNWFVNDIKNKKNVSGDQKVCDCRWEDVYARGCQKGHK